MLWIRQKDFTQDVDGAAKIEYDNRGIKGKTGKYGKEDETSDMILRVRENVKTQARLIRKETVQLCRTLEGKDEAASFDTNTVLMGLDRIEEELKTLRTLVNREKERAYIERMGGVLPEEPGRETAEDREEKAQKEEQAKREDKAQKEEKAKKEEKAPKEDKAKKEDKAQKEDKAKKEDRVSKEDKVKKEDKAKKEDKTKKEDKVKKEAKGKKENKAKKSGKEDREKKAGKEGKEKKEKKASKDKKAKKDRKA